MPEIIRHGPFLPRELWGELARINELEARVAALEAELAAMRALLQDVVGDFPRGIRSNAVEAARDILGGA